METENVGNRRCEKKTSMWEQSLAIVYRESIVGGDSNRWQSWQSMAIVYVGSNRRWRQQSLAIVDVSSNRGSHCWQSSMTQQSMVIVDEGSNRRWGRYRWKSKQSMVIVDVDSNHRWVQ